MSDSLGMTPVEPYNLCEFDGDWGAQLGTLSPQLDLAGLARRAHPSAGAREGAAP